MIQSDRQRSSCCMKTDHWLLLQLLLVVNNSQRTMGRVGFILPASNITNISFLCYTDQRVYTFIKKRDKIKIRCVKHQLYPSSGLSSREKHKPTPAPTANVSWEQRPTLGATFIHHVSPARSKLPRPDQLKINIIHHLSWNPLITNRIIHK
ncbi:hypothetical protein ILYODFUR_023195 [Ilyodon furcidens]|uniref:Uncharacterized protein n=1 Tax=Ilyodon furcidens TaxID=33524 RepID=A0ABV0SZF7_9TELE